MERLTSGWKGKGKLLDGLETEVCLFNFWMERFQGLVKLSGWKVFFYILISEWKNRERVCCSGRGETVVVALGREGVNPLAVSPW